MADLATRADVARLGRRIGENAAGTDHGAAAPMLMAGPPAGASPVSLVPGLHGDHPGFRLTCTDLEADGSLAGLFTSA